MRTTIQVVPKCKRFSLLTIHLHSSLCSPDNQTYQGECVHCTEPPPKLIQQRSRTAAVRQGGGGARPLAGMSKDGTIARGGQVRVHVSPASLLISLQTSDGRSATYLPGARSTSVRKSYPFFASLSVDTYVNDAEGSYKTAITVTPSPTYSSSC